MSQADGAAIAASLRQAVDEGLALILSVPEPRTASRRGETQWSVREVVGHLIDSACNNHRRFILNQADGPMIIDPYDQDVWVRGNRYNDRPAAELAALWAVYNRHLAHVIERMPPAVLNAGRGPIASFGFDFIQTTDTSATLGHLAEDYVGHLRHHLDQIRDLLG